VNFFALTFLSLTACVDPDAPVDPDQDTPFVFEVPPGATASGLTEEVVESGFVGSSLQWKVFLRQRDASCLKAGRFEVHLSMSLNELVDTLCGTPMADDVDFTVVEGWRIQDIDEALAAAGHIAPGDYIAVAEGKRGTAPFEVSSATFEGYLYPETYKIKRAGFRPEQLVSRQLETFDERFDVKGTDLGQRTLHEIVVMASMLEREEPRPENRPLVAGILWKRIDTDNALGVDATSRYTLDDWNNRRAFLKKLKDPDDPYNTRLRKGLPPTPIGNPTLESLQAAINPVASEYWYYLHDRDGNLHPGRNAAEHEANRARYDVY